jgi:hypothetical protein
MLPAQLVVRKTGWEHKTAHLSYCTHAYNICKSLFALQELQPFYEACAARAHSPAEAQAKLDALAGQHIEALRKLVKRVQDARWAIAVAGVLLGAVLDRCCS